MLDRYGAKESLHLADLPEPEVGPDDVLVQVRAAGVNLLDAKIRNGEFKLVLPYRLPLVLGNDVAGAVVRVGARVRGFKPGDEVYARPDKARIGTFAEQIAVGEDALALMPRNVSMVEAASLPLVGLTAWQALVERAGLKAGQKVFIQAGSGGVGTFAIQLAKQLGAFVATTTSTANVELVKALGADVVVDYRREDFADVLRDYDVVLHSLDEATLLKSLRVLKPGGHLVSISGPPDAGFAAELGAPWYLRLILPLLGLRVAWAARRRGVRYSFLFMRASGAQLAKLTAYVESGAIRPVVDRVYSFHETNEALAYVESGRAKGKVVVKLT